MMMMMMMMMYSGPVSWQVHRQWLYTAVLQEDAQQAADHQ